jgi:hypothetical protein
VRLREGGEPRRVAVGAEARRPVAPADADPGPDEG